MKEKPQRPDGKERLVLKITAAMNEIGAVPKTGVNAHFNYNFRRHEDITNKLQPALINHGLIIHPVSKKVINSAPGYLLMEATYEITDGVASLTFIGLGEGKDTGDKAAYKAQTGAMKYALNDLLMLAGQDPEDEAKGGPKDKTDGKPGTKDPTAEPQALPAAHALTKEQESQILDLSKALELTDAQAALQIQKAKIGGFEPAVRALQDRLKSKAPRATQPTGKPGPAR